ncbi:MAG: GMC family oxidoreductase [Gemmatimonadota bacterium]|nr:GMC family oxidoreductase [Gemmatimonadota bacterium]
MNREANRESISQLDTADPYDVCVIGSGPAGGLLSVRLAERGIRTLLLESGGSLVNWATDKRLKSLAQYEVSGEANYPLTRTTSRLVGGNSNFWTGRCERFHPTDFVTHPYTPDGNPWPVTFADLEPYYEDAEGRLRVRSGPLSEHAPPRRGHFPVPPRSDVTPLKELMAEAGVTFDDSPTATPRHALRFFRFHKEILPAFTRSPRGALITHATVTRLEHDADGRVTGALVRTLDGVEGLARARTYVVCCGGLHSPRLLLLSRSEHFSRGLGNGHDRVGRGFNEHPSLNVYGRLRHSRATLSLAHRIARTHQFYEQFRPEGLGAIHAVAIQSWVFPNHLLRYRLRDVPRHALRIASRLLRPTIYLSPTLEMRPVDSNRVTLSPNGRDHFGDPIAHLHLSFSQDDRRLIDRARDLTWSTLRRVNATDLEEIELTWSRHHLGSCRMGTDPKTSVVDPNLRVHESPNLYVCGSEVFVTGAAVQPVLTIAALALRLADHLVDGSEGRASVGSATVSQPA